VVTAGLVGAVLLTAAPGALAQVCDFAADPTFQQTRTAIFDNIANQIGTLPSPTGGGFTYQFDPTLGVFTRTTESFGPVFTERTETTGRGKITLNTSYTRHNWNKLDDLRLKSGTLGQILPCGTRLNVFSFTETIVGDVFTVSGLYGVTDRIDVGITIPILRVRVQEDPVRVGFRDCVGDVCGDFVPTGDASIPQDAESAGIGDLVIRAKYAAWQGTLWGGRVGAGASLDLRLPTGDKGDRQAFTTPQVQFTDPGSTRVSDSFFPLGDPPTGTGIVRVKPLLIASGTWGLFSARVNLGAELGETEGITNDLIYAVGFDLAMGGVATFAVDLIGRHSFGVDRDRFCADDFGVCLPLDDPPKAKADQLTVAVGLKANPVGTLLVFANVLIPINEVGLRSVSPTVGLEWSF
jgi:hypothetical protein